MMRLDAKSIQNEIDRLAGKKPTPPRRRQHPLPPRPSPLSTPAPQPKKEEEDVPVSFTDYELLMAPNDDGFKYNLFRFRAGNKDQVDLTTFATPIKLNRKNPKPPPPPTTAPIAGSSRASAPDIKPMLGADGKVVIGKDGQPVMVTTVDGQEVPLSKQQLKERQKLNGKDSVADGKKKAFKRKTRQVFTVPEPIRQLRREERYPWVMEDASGTQKWVGKMTSQNEDGLYAFFVVNGQKEGTFDFIPTNRVYNFMPLRRYIGSTTAEEAEAMLAEYQKKNTLAAHFERRGLEPSRATLATIRATQKYEGSPSKAQIKTEENSSVFDDDGEARVKEEGGDDLFGDDDDRVKKEDLGAEGDLDEMDFEDDVADDEENMEPEDGEEDEETKELHERIKREFIGGVGNDDDDLEEDEPEKLTGEGSQLKKTLRQFEQSDVYASDDEENPYASSEDSDEEESKTPEQIPIGIDITSNIKNKGGKNKAPSPASTNSPSSSASVLPAKGKAKGKGHGSRGGSAASSRAASPAPNQPSPRIADVPLPQTMAAAVLVRRAMSPDGNKPRGRSKHRAGPRGTSPLGNSGRATSPLANQYVAPGDHHSNQGTPFPDKTGKKRKAEGSRAGSPARPLLSPETNNAGAAHQNKKRKPGNAAPQAGAPAVAPMQTGKKRKAGEEVAVAGTSAGGPSTHEPDHPKKKKARPSLAGPSTSSSAPIIIAPHEQPIIDYLRNHPNVSTKTFSVYVKKNLPAWSQKTNELTVLLKRVALHQKKEDGVVYFTLKAGV